MTSQDYVIKGSCDFCSGSSSLHVTALPRLVVIGIVVFGYTVFCRWRVRFRMFTKTHNLTNMKFYNGITIVCQRNQKSMSVTCPEKHVGYLSRKARRLLVQKSMSVTCPEEATRRKKKTKTTTTRNATAEIFGLHAYAKNISKCKSEFV